MRLLRDVLLVCILVCTIASCSTKNKPVYQLTVTSNPSEAGSVSPVDGEFDEGTKVEITATPNDGWLFDQWEGDLSGSENPSFLMMDSDKEITALFIKKMYPLTVTIEGEGTVRESVIQEKSTDYEHGTTVELTAQPDDGWEFTGWAGAIESTENPIQVTVEDPTEIMATFKKNTTFYIAENGVTIKCPSAEVGEKGFVDGVEYEAVNLQLLRQRISEQADLTKVCTSLVTEMEYIFENNESFNQSIGNWDVSNVTRMDGLFLNADSFNQSIENWDVSQVISMYRMFGYANSFNQPIGSWNVGNVTEMTSMFGAAASFNQSIEDWDVSSVIGMSGMFDAATSFNQPIGNWDVSNVKLMADMFYNTKSFNQDLTNWCVSNFESEPQNFAEDSALEEANKPIWGTCPD